MSFWAPLTCIGCIWVISLAVPPCLALARCLRLVFLITIALFLPVCLLSVAVAQVTRYTACVPFVRLHKVLWTWLALGLLVVILMKPRRAFFAFDESPHVRERTGEAWHLDRTHILGHDMPLLGTPAGRSLRGTTFIALVT